MNAGIFDPFGLAFFRNGLLVATMAGAICGLIGCYVVLRQLSYIGHGLSHSIFGGAAASAVLSVNFYLGAGLWGLLSALMIARVARRGKIGSDAAHPPVLGMVGWQWVYVFWGIPAVLLGFGVLWLLTDRPRQAKWLTPEEAEALEAELERERQAKTRGKRMTVLEAFKHPKVLLLCAAYFCTVMCSYSMEFFMPSVINDWYQMSMNKLTWLIILPPTLALCGQLFGGWSSDHFQERRLHACLPIAMGAIAMLCAPFTKGNLPLTITCFMVAFAGFKMYMPAFWSLPSLFLAEAAAAGSIGLINSVGNLGGLAGPTLMGWVKDNTGSFDIGFYVLCGSMLISSSILFFLGLGIKQPAKTS